jgi:hypothetical protein
MGNEPDPLWSFMMEYQRVNSEPPTLREIAERMDTMNYRSSAREAVMMLYYRGVVQVIKPKGHARRYEAVDA